jgi:hypothetical protein
MAKTDLSDAEIAALIAERKELPPNFHRRTTLKARRGHGEAQIEITAPITGHQFRFILRQSHFNLLDFSAILGYTLPGSSRLFILRRYNGKSHQHTNTIEKETFYDFHIHIATERYQARGFNEERYAMVTDRYATLRQAFECLLDDCCVEIERDSGQHTLFRIT